MPEWKELLAGLSICMLVSWLTLPLVLFAPLLDDPEFDRAFSWGTEYSMPHSLEIAQYPFAVMTRARAAEFLVWFAGEMELSFQRDEVSCRFSDLKEDDGMYDYALLVNACRYGFFQGSQGKFFPEQYVSKAEAIVALIRTVYHDHDFAQTDPYRDGYVTFAYEQGITKRPTGPYLMYLIPMYEFILLLWRVYQHPTPI